MNVLDKYVVTNKRCRAYGRNVWMIDLPNKHGVAVFLNKNMRICLKMSSVRFVGPQYTTGQIVRDDLRKYEIAFVHHTHRYYVVKILEGRYVGFHTDKSPWELMPLKATVL